MTRQNCHLCEQARQIVELVAAEQGAEVREIDVDAGIEDGRLPTRFSELVPVVLVDGAEHDHWVVDPERLRRALLRRPGPAAVLPAEKTPHFTARWLRRVWGR